MDKVIARASRAGGQLVESALHSGASGSPPDEERSIRLGMTTTLIRVGEDAQRTRASRPANLSAGLDESRRSSTPTNKPPIRIDVPPAAGGRFEPEETGRLPRPIYEDEDQGNT